MGRPERVFSDEEVEMVEKLAPSLTQQQLADYFCISINTLKEIMQRDKRVSDSYNRGLTRAGIMMVEKLYDKALEGDHASMKLWLSQRMGWTDKSRTEHTGANGRPIEMDIDTHWTIEVMNDATEER
jgi:cell division protein FtsI/penicillin-binding protein 2